MWLYAIDSGKLFTPLPSALKLEGSGYSGFGEFKNQISAEGVKAHGPIPRGFYIIGKAYPHPKLGPMCMNLDPLGHDALGRSEFRIHGDSITSPGTASHGCIILNRPLRERISASLDRLLLVIPSEGGNTPNAHIS